MARRKKVTYRLKDGTTSFSKLPKLTKCRDYSWNIKEPTGIEDGEFKTLLKTIPKLNAEQEEALHLILNKRADEEALCTARLAVEAAITIVIGAYVLGEITKRLNKQKRVSKKGV